jgi:hypothetical protein
MNEPFEKCYWQARDFAKRQQMVDADFLEKYAELIVQECILTIQMGITRDGTKTEKFKRSMTHIKDIKEHFGVE